MAEIVGDRPFTHPDRVAEDLATLELIRPLLRHRVAGRRGAIDEHELDADGLEHWLVVPDAAQLRRVRPAVAVGFFGQARDVDHASILSVERDLLLRAADFEGLLAYSNVRLASGQWGNLVVFAHDGAPGHVGADDVHRQVVTVTPDHYASLRLHRLRLSDGALGEAPLELVRTRFFDFTEDPPWSDVRLAG